MQITHPHTLLILAWLAIGQLCTGCSAEDIAGEVPSEMGVLCLQMSSDEDFVQVETRAVQTLTDFTGYTFTLSNGQELSFNDGEAIIPAGTYTLSATNAGAVDGGYKGALYEGSTEFTLNAGEHKTIELDLGKPQNAKITLILTDNFEAVYENVGLKKNSNQLIRLNKGDNFSPIGEYTITANAKKGSGVQEFTNNSTITLSPGTHTKLTLDVNPITGYIKIETGGEHNEAFE